MNILSLSLTVAAFVSLQVAAQAPGNGTVGNGTLYSDYNYCQGLNLNNTTYPSIAGATLKKVQLFMRHGDRTPTSVLPGDNTDYDICNDPAEFNFMGNDVQSMTPILQSNIVITEDNPFASQFWRGNCEVGQLTNKGQQQTFQVGQDLRSIYVDQLHFLPLFLNPELIYARNTYVWRTRESAENFLNGLYPIPFRRPNAVLTLNTFPESIETLNLPTTACPKVLSLFEGFFSTPTFVSEFRAQYPLMVKINTILGVSHLSSFNQTANGDALATRYCNGMPLPCSATDPTQCITGNDVVNALASTFFRASGPLRYGAQAEEAKRLATGPILSTISKGIRGTVNGTDGVRPFEFYSAHDQSLDQILAVIADPATPWPAYASSLIFETWTTTGNAGVDAQDVVRVFYEGKVVPSNPKLNCTLDACPLDTFLTFIESYVPASMTAECF